MNRILEVWLLGQSIGQLIQADGRLSFSYSPRWLQSPSAQPLSRSLPLRPEPFDDKATRPFFAGLLPEEDKRKLVAMALQVSPQNDYALLNGIGGECAGGPCSNPANSQQGSPLNNMSAGWMMGSSLLFWMNCPVDQCWLARTDYGCHWLVRRTSCRWCSSTDTSVCQSRILQAHIFLNQP